MDVNDWLGADPGDEFAQHVNELILGQNGRWSLNGIDLIAGNHIQVRIGGHWIDVVIEHDQQGYYAIPYAVKLYKGLPARFISEWRD